MTQPDWLDLIAASRQEPQRIVQAITYRRAWETSCRPVQVTCDDGQDYVIKGANTRRSAFNDQVVGRIAAALEAPVGVVGLVDVSSELISSNHKTMKHITVGLAHGSRVVPDCSESFPYRYHYLNENRPRFALLALLFGWMVGGEKGFCYSNNPPQLVYSFDHEQFFPNGPGWTEASLNAAVQAEPDGMIVRECSLHYLDLQDARVSLERITPEVIAAAIGATPAEWGSVTEVEQIALADYVWRRREDLWSNLFEET